MLRIWKPFEAEAIEKRVFKPVPGGYHYFPFGIFGKGYLINEAQKGSFKKVRRRDYMAGAIIAVGTIAAAKLVGWLAVLVGGIVFVAAQLSSYWDTKRRLAGIPTAEEPPSTRGVWLETQAEVARTWSSKRLFWHFVVAALLLYLSVDWFNRWEAGVDRRSYWAPIFLGLASTFLLAYTALLFVLKRREREKPF